MQKKLKILLMSVLTEKNAIITEEIGICSIAAVLEQAGYDVTLINSTRSYLDMKAIIDAKPGLIGVPMYSTTENVVVKVCEELKKNLPDTVFVLGGYWPTLYGERLLQKYSVFDFVTQGEGELVFLNLANSIENGTSHENIKSLVYRKNGEIIQNEREKLIENLDDLPFPRRDLLRNNKLKYAYLSTSRGCVGNCSFCWHRNFWNSDACNRWRGRSPENIVSEIKEIVDRYGVNRFWFIDDSFEDHDATNPNRMWEIAQRIVDSELNISYETYFRSEVYKIFTPERMELIKKSGLVGIVFGTESGNEDDLQLYRKIATVEDNYNAIKYFRSNDIAVDIGFINFNPYSTFENLRKNVDFLEKTCFASVLYYLVERCGITEFSPLYYKVKADGLLIDKEEDDGCYSYHYVNESIGLLSNFLYYKYHENENSAVYFYAKKIGSIIREEFKLVNYIKRKYIPMFRSIEPIIKESEEKAWNLLEKVNLSNAECFRKLIDLAENGWSVIEAEKITEQYLNIEYIKSISDLLEKNRLGLYIQLNREGVTPEMYFNFR